MRIFVLKTCDTCRKAIRALPDAQIVDIRSDGVPVETLERAFAALGDALVNTRSTTWRELDAEARGLPPVELIAAHPTVMKRPLIEDGDRFLVGWTKDVQAALGV